MIQRDLYVIRSFPRQVGIQHQVKLKVLVLDSHFSRGRGDPI
jgi:hypothetical protein